MPWSKYDPHAPPAPEDPLQPANELAGRRARVLRLATWVTLGMTVMGYGLLAFWIWRDRAA